MIKYWIVYFLCVISLKFETASAYDDDDFNRFINNNFRDHDDFFDSIGSLLGVIFGSICFLIFVGCLCCCLCPFCFLHKSRRGRVIRQQGQVNQPSQQNLVPQQPQQIQGGAYPHQQTTGQPPQQPQAAGYLPPQSQASGYAPPQPQAAGYPGGYPPPQPQAVAGYPPPQQQSAMGYPPQPQYPQAGPPTSGYPQYPPPYSGPAMENAPPLATKSNDYNQQPAFNPNA